MAPRHLLALRFSSLGDIVLLAGPLAWLRQQMPDLKVSVATKAAFAPLLEGQPWLDEVWRLEEGGLQALANRAKREGVDATVDLHGSLRSTLLAGLLWPGVWRWRPHGLTRRRSLRRGLLSRLGQPPSPAPHVASRYAEALARACGLQAPLGPLAPHFSVKAAVLDRAKSLLGGKDEDAWVGVVPGAAWATKRWPAERYAAALDQLARQSQARFMLLGSQAEAELCGAVIAASGEAQGRCLNLAGQTPLPLLAALLSRCRTVLTNDSGPMHLAGAVGARAVAFFGPTTAAFGFSPLGEGSRVLQTDLPCRPCSLHGGRVCPIGTHECMLSIAPEAAAQAALDALR